MKKKILLPLLLTLSTSLGFGLTSCTHAEDFKSKTIASLDNNSATDWESMGILEQIGKNLESQIKITEYNGDVKERQLSNIVNLRPSAIPTTEQSDFFENLSQNQLKLSRTHSIIELSIINPVAYNWLSVPVNATAQDVCSEIQKQQYFEESMYSLSVLTDSHINDVKELEKILTEKVAVKDALSNCKQNPLYIQSLLNVWGNSKLVWVNQPLSPGSNVQMKKLYFIYSKNIEDKIVDNINHKQAVMVALDNVFKLKLELKSLMTTLSNNALSEFIEKVNDLIMESMTMANDINTPTAVVEKQLNTLKKALEEKIVEVKALNPVALDSISNI